jgi:hypothetical protein
VRSRTLRIRRILSGDVSRFILNSDANRRHAKHIGRNTTINVDSCFFDAISPPRCVTSVCHSSKAETHIARLTIPVFVFLDRLAINDAQKIEGDALDNGLVPKT